MSSDVVLTAALRNNLLSLQNTQRLIDTTQLRLATGLKVNSALDNPQNFFAAQSLNNRANDLQRLLDGISQSIRTIEEADNGITALTNLVEQAESVAIEAQAEIKAAEGFARIRGSVDLSGVTDLTQINGGGVIDANDQFTVVFADDDATGTGDTANYASINVTIAAGNTVDNIVADINSNTAINDFVRASVTSGGQLQIESLEEGAVVRIVDSTNTTATLGAAGFSALGLDSVVGTEDNNNTTVQVRQAGTAVAGRVLTSLASGTSTAGGAFEASALLSAAGFLTLTTTTATVDLTISVDGAASTAITLTDTSTIQEVIDGINNDATLQTAGVTAEFDTDTGELNITVGDNVGQVELQFDNRQNGDATIAFGFGAFASDGTLTTSTTAASELFSFVGTSADLDQFEDDFNTLREQIDDLVEDAEYRGVNLLSSDNLTTFFNEDRDNSLVTEGVDFTALGLGIDEGDFTNSANIQLAIDDVRAALTSVRNFGQSIANDLAIIQTRRDFTESTINTLTAGADDLTVADQNEEGANLLALQTRQALGTTSLSLASQSQQSVLRLF